MMYELRKTYCSDSCDCYYRTSVEKLKVGDYEELIKEAKDLIMKDIDATYDDLYVKKPETKEHTEDGYYNIFYTDVYEEYGYEVAKESDHKIGETWLEGIFEDEDY